MVKTCCIHIVILFMKGRIAGQPNKLTTEVKNKLQTVMDDVVSQLDITEMTTDQKIKMLQIGLQYLLPKLKH